MFKHLIYPSFRVCLFKKCILVSGRRNVFQSTKVSLITALHFSISGWDKLSKTSTTLLLSTVRICSIAIIPLFQLWVTEIRVGYFFRFVVIGARTMVFRYLFISLGEMVTQGLVFFISL